VAKERPGESRVAAAARRRVVRAMTASHAMVGGRGRFTTDFLRAGGARWIGKEGAEGVYAVAIAPSGATRRRAVGLALKIEDGSTRARDAVTLAVLDRLGLLPRSARRALAAYRAPEVRNARGDVVGSIEIEVSVTAAP
jgi:L-asparaginase II